jgi:hypothetical protein
MITQERLKELLHYDPETGIFITISKRGCNSAGAIVGHTRIDGYVDIRVDNRLYRAHRLAWLYTFGEWPKFQLDHINGVRNYNPISNLRQASKLENMQNTKTYETNTSGYTGVVFHKLSGLWAARIQIKKVVISLGYHKTPELAYTAYLAAKAIHHTFQPTPREASL